MKYSCNQRSDIVNAILLSSFIHKANKVSHCARSTILPSEFPDVPAVFGVKVMIAATIDPFPSRFVHVVFLVVDGLA